MSRLDSRAESGDLLHEDMSKPTGSGADGVAILSDIADRLAAEGKSVESGADGGGSSGGFSVPERHRVVPSPDSGNSPDTGAEVSPGSGADGVAILSEIGNREPAAGNQPAESGADGKGSSEGFSVPERHRVVRPPESANTPDRGDSLDDLAYGQGGNIPPEMVPEGVFVLRETSLVDAPLVEPITETSGSADVRHFLSDQAARRAEGFAEQGNNDLGYEGTCGLASNAEMLSDLTGENYTEKNVVRYAAANGLCVTDSSDPTELGGTTVETLQVLQQDAGVHSVSLRDCDLDSLAHYVDSGDGVLAAVKAAEYWPPVGIYESEGARSAALAQAGTDHFVWVTGVSRNPGTGAVTGFFVNDTGSADGAGLFVSNAEMGRAWEHRGGEVLVATRSTT